MRSNYFPINIFIIILLFSLGPSSLNAQKKMDDYTSQWKKTEELQKKGLTKSALEVVNNIYGLAKQSKNDPQIIKTLLFKITLQQNIEENASENSITKFEAEIDEQKGAAKAILQSITAQMYWNYFQQNRYRFYSRTNTQNFDKKDIATWTIDDLHQKITELYLASLQEEGLLKKTLLSSFEPIIIKGNTRDLRPTLFDLLAHRALDYFKNDEKNITRPAYAFEINDPKAFAPANEFAQHSFQTEDTSSLHHKALLIFQELLRFHEKDTQADALIDADIERMEFVNQYGVMNDKDSLFIDALKKIGNKYDKNALSARANFLMAETIYEKALEIHNSNLTSSFYTIKKAKNLLDAIVAKHPKSEGGINAQNLIYEILLPTLNLATEKVNVPGIPFRTLVNYKNLQQIHLRILELTPELKSYIRKNGRNNKEFIKMVAQKNIHNWAQKLPATDDYLSHSVEIKIDALPVGEYILLASVDPSFGMDKNALVAQFFHVSNISFINSGNRYFVLDRSTGQPLSGSKVQVWRTNYDYNTRDYIRTKEDLLTTDKNGFFKLPANKKSDERKSIWLEINHQRDHLFLDDQEDTYHYPWYRAGTETADQKNQEEFDKTNGRVFFFTDRSIYRPGQTVYFKGIGVTKNRDSKKAMLLQRKDSVTVILRDANGQQTDSMKVLFNEFGSFNGKFKLPEGKMNGAFTIIITNYQNSNTSFSVEEYKRPKFFTEFEKVTGSFRVNDTVNITGFAKAYAGNNVDGAKVTYRVTRIARFIYPWIFRGRGFPQVQPMEIAHGEALTDAEGKFSIQFEAIPDRTLDPKTDPVFDYKVEADVTDINGETRSGEIIVPIGYKALNLQITFPQGNVLNADSLKSISISSRNLSGEPEVVIAGIKIYALKSPDRLIRNRLWAEPDQFILDKKEYIQYFPHDEYKDETKIETWEKGRLILERADSISAGFQLPKNSLKSIKEGLYVVEVVAIDRYGQEVKDVKFFQVFDTKSESLPAPAYVWNYREKMNVEPGETAKFITGSSANDVFLIQELNKEKTNLDQEEENKTSSDFKFISLNNNKKSFTFKTTEEDRGGFGINEFFVKNNRFYIVYNTINVPWSNKELNISFDTWRDKTLPGSEEKWTVKITGKKGEKLGAEMLASMYDASLDQFKPHSWKDLKSLWPTYYGYNSWQAKENFTTGPSLEKDWDEPYIAGPQRNYDAFNYLPSPYSYFGRGGIVRTQAREEVSSDQDIVAAPGMELNEVIQSKSLRSESVVTVNGVPDSGIVLTPGSKEKIDQSQIQIRKNFNETAFFFPDLTTDKEGKIQFSFTMPEALTEWKLMTLAHIKDLASAYAEKTVITQKELMVQPNVPRFLREGDKMVFSAKIVNLGEKEVSGQAELLLLNATTMNPVDSWFKNTSGTKTFTAGAGQSAEVSFQIDVPTNFNEAVVYRIVAKAGNVSDGEEAAIPVVTNRMLVTESLPLHMRGDGTKEFTFEKLLNSDKSSTLTNYSVTVEYTTNPAWYAVQAIPYLMEYPYDCSEQNFNRFYANALAMNIANSSPKIKAIFEKWRTSDTSALMSNLQKNEELKSVLLQETPWVMQAKSEAEQKKNIALLFDMVKMSQQLDGSLNKLINMQSPNGGFAWFKGGPDDRYVTQYIVTGIGHLKQLNAYPADQEEKLNSILKKAIPYLDNRLKEDYDQLIKRKANLKENQLSTIAIQYLYMRSFFPDHKIPAATQKASTFYREQTQKYWLAQSKYMQGMIALALNRTGDNKTAKGIIQSLKENSINNEELGMYWKEWDRPGYWWYQAPIESQALMIEAFTEIDKDPKTIGDLKTWLLKNKQTTNWKTTKATAEAVYALLLQGTDWLSEERNVVINLGKTTFNSNEEKQDAGTGYFKRRIDGDKVKPEMGNIKVSVKSDNTSTGKIGSSKDLASWGSVYWQYFEDLDKITFAETPLKLSKKLFIEKNTDKGPVLTPVNEGDNIHIGDKINVRIELRVDRDMEYVHMKDMRASAMEPTNVISQYKWQGGLGYYETTKDVSTNFFFNYLPKGTYVFEYPMFVTHAGNFSNGITTIQSMYAPEFTAHSEGVRVEVEK